MDDTGWPSMAPARVRKSEARHDGPGSGNRHQLETAVVDVEIVSPFVPQNGGVFHTSEQQCLHRC